MKTVKNVMEEMEKSMSQDSIDRSDKLFAKELMLLNLAELREKFNIRQTDIKGFSQPAISRLESRKDIKLSTLVKYISQMGLKMEINVRPQTPKKGLPKKVKILEI